MPNFKGYTVDWTWRSHPAWHTDCRGHYKSLSDVRRSVREAVTDGSIYRESVKVIHTGRDGKSEDVTASAMQKV